MSKLLRILIPTLALTATAAWLVSCSKNNPSSPPPPPGELSGTLAASGGTYAHAFATAGTFNYECSVHPSCGSLKGVIVVIPVGTPIANHQLSISQSGGTSDPYGPVCSSLSLQRDTVYVGDTVTWTNTSAIQHTITSQ